MSAGFENAPITQVLSGFALLLGWFHGSSKTSSLDLFKLGEGELWRLIASQLVFENTAETVVGVILLYCFRQFERQMGTRKFGFFVFLSYVISLFNLITVEILLLSVDAVYIPASGPYFLIFSMLAIFHCKPTCYFKWSACFEVLYEEVMTNNMIPTNIQFGRKLWLVSIIHLN